MTTTERGTCWSLTINNPTPDDDECIAKARAKRWTVDGQLEKGEKGTPHYQLMVRTPQVRSSAVRSAFPRAHVELAKNAKALAKYVTKEDTRAGQLPTGSDKFPSLEKTYDMFVKWLLENKYKKEVEDFDDRWSTGIFMTADFWRVVNKDKLMELFDECCSHLIEDGYFVEQWAVNPQVRSALMKFGKSIVIRHSAMRDDKTLSNIRSITNAVPEEEDSPEEKDDSPPALGSSSPADSC